MPITPLTATGDRGTFAAASGTAIVVPMPANTTTGDTLLALVYAQTAGTMTTPSGWTLIYKASATSTRNFAAYVRTVTNAATEPTSYTWTASVSSRLLGDIIRVNGVSATTPIDAAPTSDFYNSSAPTTLPAPGVTAAAAAAGLFVVSFTNDTTATSHTFTLPGGTSVFTNTVTSGAAGSATNLQYVQLSSAGATGTETVSLSPQASTGGSFAFTLNPAPGGGSTVSGAAALSVGSSLGTTASVTEQASATMSSGTTLSATAAGSPSSSALTVAASLSTSARDTTSAAAAFTVAATLSAAAAVPTPVASMLYDAPAWAAHRNGFYATYGEMTRAGYSQLAAWNRQVAFNVDVWLTPDGVWVASHDQNTSRVFGASYDIPTTPWTTLQSLTTLVGGYPIATLDQIVADHPEPWRRWFIDNKANTNTATFFAKLASLFGSAAQAKAQVVNKNYIGSLAMLQAAQNNGYTTWAYAFDADMTALANNQQYATWLGFDYAGTQANWNTVIGYGKPSFAHILPSTAARTTADQKAAAAGGSNFGYMVSNVPAVVPQTGIILTASPTLSSSSNATTGAAAALTATSTLGAPASVTDRATSTMSATTALATSASVTDTAAAALTATPSLAVSAAVTEPATIALTAQPTLGTAATDTARAAAALTSSTVLSSAPTGTSQGAAPLTTAPTLTVAASGASGASTALLVVATLGGSAIVAKPAATALTVGSTLATAATATTTGQTPLSVSTTLGVAALAQLGAAASLTSLALLSAAAQSASPVPVLRKPKLTLLPTSTRLSLTPTSSSLELIP